MTDLLTLADRVAQAEGADRELDEAIARAINWRPHWALTPPNSGVTYYKAAAPFTASLDAALSLVPEGHVACVANGRVSSPQIAVGGSAVCGDPAWTDTKPVEAATPALALCAAALRARHASGAGEG